MSERPRVVGFVCDWSVDLAALLEGGALRDAPGVRIIRVPCSGFVRPAWLEEALNAGADGVFVTGCPYGDCLNREGNYLMRDRVDQLQRRLLRRRIDPARLGMLAHGLHDREAFLAEVRAFVDRLRALAAAPVAGQPTAPVAGSGPTEGER
ncbi:MAG TPA: hydrogenase iron-sulfur subunit [bacterium]|nr:hydrogenase iron-sulfur subunit [bacterium]